MSANNILRIREDGVRNASPRPSVSKSALIPLIVTVIIGVALILLLEKRQSKPAAEPEALTEEQEKAQRKADLERVREDFRRNQPPPIDGIARYEENVQ